MQGATLAVRTSAFDRMAAESSLHWALRVMKLRGFLAGR